jgi:DNA-binding Lrp family transcriptional regulator
MIELIETDAKINYRALADNIGVSRATTGREIKKLKDNNILVKMEPES